MSKLLPRNIALTRLHYNMGTFGIYRYSWQTKKSRATLKVLKTLQSPLQLEKMLQKRLQKS